MRRSLSLAGVLVSILVAIVFFTQASFATGTAVRTHGEYSTTDGEDRPIYDGDALELDAQAYASDFGVTFEEALDRLRYQIIIGELGAELAEKESDTFAGLWIQNRPEYRFMVMFTRDGEQISAPYIEGKPYEDLIEVRKAKVTLEDLKDLQDKTWLDLQEAGIPEKEGLHVNHGIRISDNRVILYVTDPAVFNAALEEADVQLSDYVKIQADGVPRETAQMYAGRELIDSRTGKPCTTGFSVIHHGSLGISTAGHCDNDPIDVDTGRDLPYKSGIWSGDYDVQWHLAPDFWVRNLMWDGTWHRYVYDSRHHVYQQEGQYVCKWGQDTQGGCGTIIDLHYNGEYVRVTNSTEDLGEPGDSGGPWIKENTAYGLMTGDIEIEGDPEAGNDAYYMPINRIDVLGLYVYTGNSFLYQHVFWSPSSCTEYKTDLDRWGNPDWSTTSEYPCSTYAPGSGTIESYTTYVSGGKLREAMWRGGNGYTRDIPIAFNGLVNWGAAPGWTLCCTGGGPSEQGAYVTGLFLYQHVFWSASSCTEYKTELDPATGDPLWSTTSEYPCSTSAPGSGTIESYTTYVSGGKLREAMWQDGNGYIRDIPLNDDGTVNWGAAPSWTLCCTGGGPSEQGAYVLSQP